MLGHVLLHALYYSGIKCYIAWILCSNNSEHLGFSVLHVANGLSWPNIDEPPVSMCTVNDGFMKIISQMLLIQYFDHSEALNVGI